MRFLVFLFLLGATLVPGLRADECPASTREALLGADRQFAADVDRGGLDAWMRHFTEDATVLSPADEQIRGRKALDAFYRQQFRDADRLPKWTPVHADCSADGSMGFTYGTWTSRVPGQASGHYVSIWRKQPDGRWKVLFDLGNVRP